MTDVAAGTDLSGVLNSSGSYNLLAGGHTVSADLDMADTIDLTGEAGAQLSITGTALLRPGSNTRIHDLSIVMASGAGIRLKATAGSTHQHFVDIDSCRIAGGLVQIYAGFGNALHTDIKIARNTFTGSGVICNIASRVSITSNTFENTVAGTRAIRVWGNGHRIIGNTIRGGVVGITYISNASAILGLAQCNDGIISGNVISEVTEEAISIDSVANTYASCSVREYDTIAVGGSADAAKRTVTLSDAGWAGSSAFDGSKFHLVFISGTNAGKAYLITAHANAAFTLDITDGEYDTLSDADECVVCVLVYGITIANNTITSTQGPTSGKGSGIVFHGCGHGCDISNNYVDVLGSSGDPGTWAFREADLNTVTYTVATSICDNYLRCPVGVNTVRNNFWAQGATGRWYKNYGAEADFTPVTSTLSGNITSGAVTGGGVWIVGVRASDDLPLPLRPDIGAVQDRNAPGRRFGVGGGNL